MNEANTAMDAVTPLHEFKLGDPVHVLVYRPFFMDMSSTLDRGSWDIVMGVYLMGDEKRILFECDVKSTASELGGDWPAPEGSTLRIRSREYCFPSRQAAEAVRTTLPRPVVNTGWRPATT
jgi:hypothetical protein